MIFPRARDERFRTTDTTTTTSYKTVRVVGSINAQSTDLFPFSTGCEETDKCLGYSSPSRDNGGMVNELVGTKLQYEECADESSDVKGNQIPVTHVSLTTTSSMAAINSRRAQLLLVYTKDMFTLPRLQSRSPKEA